MSDIVRLDKFKAKQRQARAKGVTLCRNGFHRWKLVSERRFDVKHGRLLTTYRCERCGTEKHRAE